MRKIIVFALFVMLCAVGANAQSITAKEQRCVIDIAQGKFAGKTFSLSYNGSDAGEAEIGNAVARLLEKQGAHLSDDSEIVVSIMIWPGSMPFHANGQTFLRRMYLDLGFSCSVPAKSPFPYSADGRMFAEMRARASVAIENDHRYEDAPKAFLPLLKGMIPKRRR